MSQSDRDGGAVGVTDDESADGWIVVTASPTTDAGLATDRDHGPSDSAEHHGGNGDNHGDDPDVDDPYHHDDHLDSFSLDASDDGSHEWSARSTDVSATSGLVGRSERPASSSSRTTGR